MEYKYYIRYLMNARQLYDLYKVSFDGAQRYLVDHDNSRVKNSWDTVARTYALNELIELTPAEIEYYGLKDYE